RGKLLVRAGQPQKALVALDGAVTGGDADVAEALYQRARILDDLDRRAEAATAYRAVIARYPSREVGAASLWRLGWLAWLAGDAVRLYGISSAYVKEERYHLALRIFRRSLAPLAATGDPALPQAFWETFYPLGWRAELTAAAQSAGLDPYLVAAVVREESSYYPRALSPVGARARAATAASGASGAGCASRSASGGSVARSPPVAGPFAAAAAERAAASVRRGAPWPIARRIAVARASAASACSRVNARTTSG